METTIYQEAFAKICETVGLGLGVFGVVLLILALVFFTMKLYAFAIPSTLLGLEWSYFLFHPEKYKDFVEWFYSIPVIGEIAGLIAIVIAIYIFSQMAIGILIGFILTEIFFD